MRQDLSGDGPFEPAALRVAGADEPTTRLAQLAGATVELFHLTGELGGQPGVAEGESGLVGLIRQQVVIPVAQRVPGRPVHRDGAEPLAAVEDRNLLTGGDRVRRPEGRPASTEVVTGVDAEHRNGSAHVDRPCGGLGYRREQRRGVRTVTDRAAEVGERPPFFDKTWRSGEIELVG